MATLEDVAWSKESYTPRTLLAQFGNRLPVIIQICSGYCGASDENTLAASEVVRIHSWVNQKRVLARDMRGRLLSIPEDYVIKFEVLSQKKKRHHRAKKLKDVLKKYHLPVTVRFDTKTRWKFRVGEEVYESNSFGQMHLVKSYVDTYLRTNPIRDGAIDQRVLLFPVSIDATMKVAEGFRGLPTTDWVTQLDYYTRALRGVRFDKMHGVVDITVFSNTTDEDMSDEASTLQVVTPRLGNGVKATMSPPSEIASEKMTQTSVPSSETNTSINTSVVTEMSSAGKRNDVSGQHVARIQVVNDASMSPTYISGPVAQLDELHISPVAVQCNGGLLNGGDENFVTSGRPRTYSDGAAGERMWKAKMQRSKSSTIHTYGSGGSGGGPSPRHEQRVVYAVNDARQDPVFVRRESANSDRQHFRSVENVRYEAPPASGGYLLQPATRHSVQRQSVGDSVPIIVRDGGSRIGCGRVTSSTYSVPSHRQYPTTQEIYSDEKLHVGLVTEQPYRDVYRYNGGYEPGGSVRSERVYVRYNPPPRHHQQQPQQQQRVQHLRRHTTLPSGGGHRFANRYAEYATSGGRDYDMGYTEQRIVSRPPREYDEFDGEYRGANLGQVTIHGPGLMTTGRYRLTSPSNGGGRTWMYSEDDRSDVFGRDDQGYREVSRRSTFCGGSSNVSRRTADNWVSFVDVSDMANTRRNGRPDTGYDDIAANSFEYRANSGYRNGRDRVTSLPRQREQRRDVFYEEDVPSMPEGCAREIQTEMRRDWDDDGSRNRDVIGHSDDMSPRTDYTDRGNGAAAVEVIRRHEDEARSNMKHTDAIDAQTGSSTPKGDASETTSTHTLCAEDTSTVAHAALARNHSDKNNNDESAPTNDDVTASRREGASSSRGLDRRGSINSLRDVISGDKSKTAAAELTVFSTSESFNEALNGAAPSRTGNNLAPVPPTTITNGASIITTTTESHVATIESLTGVVTRRHHDTTTLEDGAAHDDAVVHLETSARDSIIDLDKYLQSQIEQDCDAHSEASTDHRPDRKLGEQTVVEGNPWYEVPN